MVVRLVGDATEYKQMLTESAQQTKETAHIVEESAKQIEGFSSGLKTFAQNAVGALEALGAASYLKGGMDKAIELERNVIGVRAAIEMNTQAIDATVESHKAFVKEMSEASVASHGEIWGLIKRAESFGQTGEKAQEAAKQAMALAAATDTDALSMMRVTGELAKGTEEGIKHAQMWARHIPQLSRIRNEHEFLEKVEKLTTMGMKKMSEETKTTYGELQHMEHNISNLKRDIGVFVLSVAKPFIHFFVELSSLIRGLSPDTKKWLALVLAISAAVVGFHPTIKALTIAFGPLKSAVMALLTPLGPLLLIAGGLLALWVQDMGGVEKAWKKVTEAANDFWRWVKPIFDATESFLTELWKQTKIVFRDMWQFAKEAWAGIGQTVKEVLAAMGIDAEQTFGDIRKSLVTAIQFAEFTLTHFRMVANYTWTLIKYGAAAAADFIAQNVFYILLAVVVKRLLTHMVTSFRLAWVAVYLGAVAAVALIGVAIGKIIGEAIRRAFKGEILSFEDAKKLVAQTIEVAVDFVVGGVEVGDLKNIKGELAKQLDKEEADIKGAFDEWKVQQWWKGIFAAWQAPKAKEVDPFKPVAESARKAANEVKGLDAALKGSGEAVKRITEYNEKMFGNIKRDTVAVDAVKKARKAVADMAPRNAANDAAVDAFRARQKERIQERQELVDEVKAKRDALRWFFPENIREELYPTPPDPTPMQDAERQRDEDRRAPANRLAPWGDVPRLLTKLLQKMDEEPLVKLNTLGLA